MYRPGGFKIAVIYKFTIFILKKKGHFEDFSKQKNPVVATTYFRAVALSSALSYFTSVFGMGTGGASSV
jgi:hypothetical protein